MAFTVFWMTLGLPVSVTQCLNKWKQVAAEAMDTEGRSKDNIPFSLCLYHTSHVFCFVPRPITLHEMPITAAVYCQVFAYLTNYVLFVYLAQHEVVKCNLMSEETCCSPKVKAAGIWEANENSQSLTIPPLNCPWIRNLIQLSGPN